MGGWWASSSNPGGEQLGDGFAWRCMRVVLIVAAYAPDTTLQAHDNLTIHVS